MSQNNETPSGRKGRESSSSPADDERLFAAARAALGDGGSTLERQKTPPPCPRTIGQYRIVSVLGEGGMGIVYEAEQHQPRRPVALKVVRGGRFVDRHYVHLFQREAQTLARLKHPGIAAIYEAGCTDDGQHFFAMELVRGVPLNRYLLNKQPPLKSRLELFRRICDAINYAHQRGVIHRDLKPSNILIDADGDPKVLDFGLARITESDIAATTVVTEVGKIQGTLAYMSPEQARGNPDEIDVRADVYSLGVILYELVTDQLPYRVERTMLLESVRVICEEAPRRPGVINRNLRGDVETIVLKALAKEPSRRYQSAASLGEDVERFLTNQPILARPPSTVYQFRKLVARHKAPFAFVAILFLLVAGFAVWMRVLYRAEQAQRRFADRNLARALQAEQHAADEAETAKRVSTFLVDLFNVSDPNETPGETITARAILDQGAGRIGSELAEQPAVKATLMDTMGRVYRNLALYEPATRLLEEALRIRRATFGPDHLSVAESLNNLGWLLKLKGDYAAAEPLVRDALAMRRRLLGDEHLDVATSLLVLAEILLEKGDYAAAEPLIREALGIQQSALGRDHRDVAITLETLADAVAGRGDFAQAEALLRDALATYHRLRMDDHPLVASTISSLVSVLQTRGHYSEAEAQARRVLSIRRRTLGPDHTYVASAMVWLGKLARDQGDLATAEPLIRQALRIYRKRLAPDHRWITATNVELARVLLDKGAYEEAEKLFGDALVTYRTHFGGEHDRMVRPLLGLGRILLDRERANDAEPLLRQALTVCRKALQPDHWLTASTESLLGGCLAALGRYKEAEPLVVRGYRLMKRSRDSPGDRYVRAALRRVIVLYDAWQRPAEAARYRVLLSGPE